MAVEVVKQNSGFDMPIIGLVR